MVHPAINTKYTISNNPHEIVAVLGIEAVRAWVFREFYELISRTGKSINPRHIQIIADEMVTTGSLMSFTARGSSRQNHGAFSEASFEQALQAFRRSAMGGECEPVKSTSTSVLFGNRCAFGTGAFEIETTTNTSKEPRPFVSAAAAAGKTPSLKAVSFETVASDAGGDRAVFDKRVAEILASNAREEVVAGGGGSSSMALPPLPINLTIIPDTMGCAISKIDINALRKRFTDI